MSFLEDASAPCRFIGEWCWVHATLECHKQVVRQREEEAEELRLEEISRFKRLQRYVELKRRLM